MTNSNNRPVIFIGSSSEGHNVARALQMNLDHDAEVILWSQGVFGLSDGTLESLVSSSSRYDFAVLVLTPDDLTLSRDNLTPSPRDNVIFELGLFMGLLGRERCYLVYDRNADIKMPSDLAGVTAATFQPPTAGNLQSALGAPSTQILTAVQRLGCVNRSEDEVYIDQRTHFGVIADLLDIATHQFFIAMHERGIVLRREEPYMLGLPYEYSIMNDRDHSQGHGGFGVNKLCKQLADAHLLVPDLRGRIDLSQRGHAFAEWMIASGFKAQYFWCDLASWGDRPQSMDSFAHPSRSPRTVFELPAPSGTPDETSPPNE
jgi:hypothetical protein